MSSQSSGEGRVTRSASPSDKQPLERSSRRTSAIIAADENLLTPSRALSRNDKANLGFLGSSSATSSPLKRSDGGMDVDRARSGSPVAKRRSLHGGTFGADFNIFEHGPSMADHQEPRIDSSRDFDFGTTTAAATSMKNQSVGGSSPFFGSMPKRSSSLRKSTLQQRHNEKPAFARQRPNPDLALDFAFASPGPAGAKGRGHRMSLENFLPPMQRDSPFSSHGALPNASVHVVPQHNSGPQAQHQPHPLSYTMTQSSSGSSLADGVVDDSPTHAPLHHHSDVPRSVLDLSRSLPMGATRPTARERSSQKTSSSEASYVTPHNYKLVKPLPAAFMSTGLISKRNRSTEEQQFGRTGSHAQMPDTPCKRPTAIFQASPAPSRRPTTIFQASPGPVHGGSAFGKVGEVRHEFGTPSTPFNPHSSRPVPGTGSFGEGLGVFGSGYGVGGLVRRDSFVSVEGDETNLSPSVKGDSQSSEYDLPPTPTKQIFSLGRPRARSASHDRLALESAKHNSMTEPRCVTALGIRSSQEEPKCKSTLSPKGSSPGSLCGDDDEGDSVMSVSPSQGSSRLLSSSAQKPMSPTFLLSAVSSKCLRMSQIAMSKKLLISPGLSSSRKFKVAKKSRLSPASPSQKFDSLIDRGPHTPKDSILPPDPSGLSISAGQEAERPVYHRATGSSSSMLPPATPTAVRDSFQQHHRRSSITPINGFANTDVDPSLSSRFDKVELIGTGEFSLVYRVTEPVAPPAATSPYLYGVQSSSARSSLQTLTLDRVFAVKKSRHAYAGTRDRQRKSQEVRVLESLGQSDHVIHFIDSWEEKNHLYIQTEFCEEGSLEMFLAQVGRKARLDDFRIWKVMLELSLVCVLYSFLQGYGRV